MTENQVLQHIQAQFPGQLVLYPPQIAVVLGKSESALSHLIDRKRLPFQLKLVGGRRAVDIFTIASWLYSQMQDTRPEAATDQAGKPASRSSAPKKPPRPKTGSGRVSLAQYLSKMRAEASTALREAVAAGEYADGAPFFAELATELFAIPDEQPSDLIEPWVASLSPGVQAEVEAWLALDAEQEKFYSFLMELMVTGRDDLEPGMLSPLYACWHDLDSILAIRIAFLRLKTAAETQDYFATARDALQTPEDVAEFEELHRLDDELPGVMSWLRDKAVLTKARNGGATG